MQLSVRILLRATATGIYWLPDGTVPGRRRRWATGNVAGRNFEPEILERSLETAHVKSFIGAGQGESSNRTPASASFKGETYRPLSSRCHPLPRG